MANQFDMNQDGTVKACPLLGCLVISVANSAILLQLRYADTPADYASGGKVLQTVFGPMEALRLAQDLTEVATALLKKDSIQPTN